MIRRRRSLSSLSTLFSSIASTVGAWWGGGYNAVDPRRKLIDRITALAAANRSTANELLSGSIPMLRSFCRGLERNNPTARAAVHGLRAMIVGTGIALEIKDQDRLRDAWEKWIQHCGINGESLYELQNTACGEMVTTGEFLWRYIVLPELAERGEIPLRILPLESEWLADESLPLGDGLTAVSGIDLDVYGRPVRYRLRNPAAHASGNLELIPAAQINHRFERRRPIQNRGEPWFAPNIETLLNERDLVDAELYAARQSAAPAIVIESERHDALDSTEYGTSTDPVSNFKLGGIFRLYPGEKMSAHSHTRPSQQIAPFRQMLRGDIAASMRIPQRFLDRDVSRANYSSMKSDQIDSERLLGPIREWFGHATAGDAFAHVAPWLQLATKSKATAVDYELIPDETPYLDPQKDVAGALLAITGGLSTWQKEIGKRGGDARKVLEQLSSELENPILNLIFNGNQPKPPVTASAPAKTEEAA